MARTSEATTRETRGAGSVYWTRPRSNIGARAVDGLVCWLSCYTQGSDGMTVQEEWAYCSQLVLSCIFMVIR